MKKTITALAILVLSLVALVSCSGEDNPIVNANVPVIETTQIFHLEYATDHERFTSLFAVTLHNDGSVEFATSPISSFFPPPSYAVFSDSELLVYSKFQDESDEPIAIFEFADGGNVLIFRSSTVPLRAEPNMRFIRDLVASANGLPQAIYLENVNDHDRTAMYYAPDGESTSRLVIYSDGQFALVASDYVSFVLSGVHTTENDKLFLGTDDVHTFRIEDERLVFESGTWLENWIGQGTGFYPIND